MAASDEPMRFRPMGFWAVYAENDGKPQLRTTALAWHQCLDELMLLWLTGHRACALPDSDPADGLDQGTFDMLSRLQADHEGVPAGLVRAMANRRKEKEQ